jgi:hypothetical protein
MAGAISRRSPGPRRPAGACPPGAGRLLRPPAHLADWASRAFGLDLPLGVDKLGELGHGQWVAAGPALPWAPSRITFEEGFARTLDWYRQEGWL